MLFTIFLILCVTFLLILKRIYNSGYWNTEYWEKRNVVEVNGTFWDFLKNERAFAVGYKKVYDDYPNEPYVGVYQGHKPVLIVRDMDNIKAILGDNFQNFYSRGIMTNPHDLLADNILHMDDYRRWKCIRHKMTVAFDKNRLMEMFYIVERCAHEFVEMVEDNKHMRENPFDVIFAYTSGSIASYIFGLNEIFTNIMESSFLDLTRKLHEPSLISDVKYLVSTLFPGLYKFLKVKLFGEHEYFIEVVKRAIHSHRKDKFMRFDFVDLCLTIQRFGVMHDFMTNCEIFVTYELMAAQAFFFFLTGVDTSASAMHFTLLELSYNSAILEKVHKEIDEVFDEFKGNFTHEGCMKLKYLDMVVSEAVRKYPPLGLIQRKCTKETVLPVGNLKVEEGVLVAIPVFGIHRDEKYYPNPETFDPERFVDNNVVKSPNYTYLAFGAGPRNCLGVRLARMQIKSGLAWLLRRFTLTEQSPQQPCFDRSFFSLRAPTTSYELVTRDIDEE